MPKITIAEAARRLETTEEVIREWIRLGLLDVEPLRLERRRTKENILAFYVNVSTPNRE
jgi:predicted site-specific integrase-resolvase